jgi:hypothetical protein
MSSKEVKNKTNNEEKEEENEEKVPKEIYIDGCSAFFLVILIILILIGSLVTLIIYLNFLIDSNKYNFDKIGFTRLSKNKHFSLCGAFSCVDSWYSSFILNFIILFVLFFQEVVISSKWVRLTFIKRAIGDLLYFPKYIIRFMTLFNFSMINMLYQPMNFENLEIYPKLHLTDYFHPAFLLIPLFLGLYLIFSSLHYNLILNDELGIIMLYNIIKGKPVGRLGDYLYGYNIYQKIRSPFRAGIMLTLLSFSPVWDYGRCLYTFFFWFALYVEGVNDDRYFFEKYEAYREYIRRVPTRFFYLDFLFGNKKKNILEENKKEEEENKNNENDKEYRRRRKNNKKKQE